MKVLWIMATPMGRCAAAFGKNVLGSGGWIDASIDHLEHYLKEELDLHVAALADCNKETEDKERGIHYYLLKCPQIRGRANRMNDLDAVDDLLKRVCPDLIQVWGTEYSIGYDIMQLTKIPIVLYIQGVMSSLVEHENGDLRPNQLKKSRDPFYIAKLIRSKMENEKIRTHLPLEKAMVKQCSGIIVDNEWASNQYNYSKTKRYYIPLPINSVFSLANWDICNCKRNTIFTVAGRTPLKGLHILIEAVAIVKNSIPDVSLYIPGNIENKKPDLLFAPLYLEYLRNRIRSLGLENNVHFLGKLTQREMSEKMQDSHVFVMPSCVENHSSTLREAMSVGCPCISSTVGSVCEYVSHHDNGLLYRYDDVKMLAGNIISIFNDDQLASNLGANAKASIVKKYPQEKIGELYIQTYKDVIARL